MTEQALGNIFVRGMHFDDKVRVVNGHKHTFDHVTYCILGKVLVERDFPIKNEDGTFSAYHAEKELGPGDYILIQAGVEHKITALTDGALCHCIYAHREPQGEIVQHFTGWGSAYS
jgi:quercetin dioxygenase-like cupin family protein